VPSRLQRIVLQASVTSRLVARGVCRDSAPQILFFPPNFVLPRKICFKLKRFLFEVMKSEVLFTCTNYSLFSVRPGARF